MKPAAALRLTVLDALGAYIFALRPWFLRWGATQAEFREIFPGDELVLSPKHHDTHAITIDAPLATLWPWLIQIGQDKGGFYSYAWLENLAGCHIHNADHIVAEYQTLKTGDGVRLHPDVPPLRAVIVKPYKAIVLMEKAAAESSSTAFQGNWGFYVRRVNDMTTRLLIRSRWQWNSGLFPWFGFRCLLELAHFIMERKMLLNIKSLVERAG